MLLRIAAHIVKILGIPNPFASQYPEYVAAAIISKNNIEQRPEEPGLAKVIPLFPNASGGTEYPRRHLS